LLYQTKPDTRTQTGNNHYIKKHPIHTTRNKWEGSKEKFMKKKGKKKKEKHASIRTPFHTKKGYKEPHKKCKQKKR